jgi:hypothetical protein
VEWTPKPTNKGWPGKPLCDNGSPTFDPTELPMRSRDAIPWLKWMFHLQQICVIIRSLDWGSLMLGLYCLSLLMWLVVDVIWSLLFWGRSGAIYWWHLCNLWVAWHQALLSSSVHGDVTQLTRKSAKIAPDVARSSGVGSSEHLHISERIHPLDLDDATFLPHSCNFSIRKRHAVNLNINEYRCGMMWDICIS